MRQKTGQVTAFADEIDSLQRINETQKDQLHEFKISKDAMMTEMIELKKRESENCLQIQVLLENNVQSGVVPVSFF